MAAMPRVGSPPVLRPVPMRQKKKTVGGNRTALSPVDLEDSYGSVRHHVHRSSQIAAMEEDDITRSEQFPKPRVVKRTHIQGGRWPVCLNKDQSPKTSWTLALHSEKGELRTYQGAVAAILPEGNRPNIHQNPGGGAHRNADDPGDSQA